MPSFTLSATRCCWAPSWRLRSRRRRSSSWAVTSRCRDARRSTSRACRSQSARRSSARGLPGRRGGQQVLLHRAQGLPAALGDAQRTQQVSLVAHLDQPAAPSIEGSASPDGDERLGSARHPRATRPPPARFPPLRSHTSARCAPVPSASTRAMRGITSSWRTTRRRAQRTAKAPRMASRACRTPAGWPLAARARVPVGIPPPRSRSRGSTEPRLGLPPPPTSAPIPTAMPTYTAVMNTASEPYTRVRLMTMSMSYSRYLSTAIPMAAGTANPQPSHRPR